MAPTWYLAFYINEPAFVPRIAWFRFLDYAYWELIPLVLTTGLLWHWVALNVASLRNYRELFLFKSLPLRVSANSLLFALGVLLGFVNAESMRGDYLLSLTTGPWWIYVIVLFQVFWPAALILFPGYDLGRLIRHGGVQRP